MIKIKDLVDQKITPAIARNLTLEQLKQLPRHNRNNCSVGYYFSNKPCTNGHLAARKSKINLCVMCEEDRKDDRAAFRAKRRKAKVEKRDKSIEYFCVPVFGMMIPKLRNE
jgi:hypothetical protein